ncbi:MAG: PAS domain S-box protein [Pontiellaceae bacterium]|nr:PAS domain S-box protein [Pontiellaceae bacterium]MBN2783331.1 PAS domain S-box protein [Pontiellaceae bacterium]
MKYRVLRSFLAEPIIQMIITHVAMIIIVATGILSTGRFARANYYEPADREIENRLAQGKLAEVMVGMLKDISVDYRRLLDCENNKSVALYTGQLRATCSEINQALKVLEHGGSYTHEQLVNFYDKDVISETIDYRAEAKHKTSIYQIDIEPKLDELQDRISETETLVLESIADRSTKNPTLRLTELQTEALLHRLTESANKVFYDIRESNKATLAEIRQIRDRVQTIVLLVNIVANIFVVGVALVISYKIFLILKKQQETETQNRRLSTLVEQNPSAIVITDLDGTIEYVNPAFLKISGYEYDEVIGCKPSVIKSDETPEHVFEDLWGTITAGDVWSDRLCNKRKDGSLFYEQVVISPVRNARGEIINYVSVKLDITQMVALEEEQKRTALSMKSIVDNLPLGVALINKQKRIIELNQEAARILGCSTPEEANRRFLGRECRAAFCDSEFESCPIIDQGKNGVYFAEKTISLNQDVCVLKSVIMINYNGEDVLMEVFFDITDRKLQEQRLKEEMEKSNQLMEEARAANQVKSDFLANMSHEIRTPLNSIIGMNQLLRRTELSEIQKKYIEQTKTASHMLLSIINDILDFSKIEAGKVEPEVIDVALIPFLNELKAIIEPQSGERALELKFTIDPELPDAVKTDRLRLGQVLLNLLGNAVKFTHDGFVELSVSAAPGELDDHAGCRIHFEVRDTGIGISPENMAVLFQPFSQSDMSTTRKYGGTGLGLVISNRLTRMLGGELHVDSEPGRGSRFYFDLDLPTGHCPIVEQNHPASQEFPDFSRYTILMAEDNDMNQQVAIGLMEPTGVSIALVPNGREAVRKVQENGFDLILMDLQMPVMDGYEAIRTIRKTHPDLPIVALSAAATAEDRQRAKEAGANVHVSKPIDQEDLFREMSRYLHRKAPSSHRIHAPAQAPEPPAGLPDTIVGFDMKNARMRLKSNLHKHLWNLRKTFGSRFSDLPLTLREKTDEHTRRELHTLKGLAGTFGALRLYEAAIQAEIEIKSDTGLSKEALQEFDASLREMLSGLEQVPEYKMFEAAGPEVSPKILEQITALLERHRRPPEELLGRASRYLSQTGQTEAAEEILELVEKYQLAAAAARITSLLSDTASA